MDNFDRNKSDKITKEDLKILMVEDEEAIAKPLGKILELYGYETAWAKDGIDALDWLSKNNPPNCLLVDIMMPRMNGWEFREAQLKDSSISSIPVVFFSADTHSANRAEKLGEYFVPKPIDLTRLNEMIADSIATNQGRQALK